MGLEAYLTKNPKTHLIFDFDRTIAELSIDWSEYHHKLFETLNMIDPGFAKDAVFVGKHWMDLSNNAVKQYGEKAVNMLRKFTTYYEDLYFDSIYSLNNELVSFIKKTERVCYIWSSNSRAIIEKALERENLRAQFRLLITRDEVDFLKPDADGFAKIYDGKNSKNHYLMIGDSWSDEQAAKNAGIDFLKINYFD